jgi:glucose-6-phosphate 1-dehydrogenase
LYKNKLSIALFDLFYAGLLPKEFRVLAFARRDFSSSGFQTLTKEFILKKHLNKAHRNTKEKLNFENKLESFLKKIYYIKGDFTKLDDFAFLAENLKEYDILKNFCTNKLFYLAVPPHFYAEIFQNISKAGLTIPCKEIYKKNAWTRVLVEKPFGKNILEAEKLDKMLSRLFDESQIFRIDHYLAKETMQNIINFRFSNKTLESLWNNKKIEKIRIVLHESGVVGSRGMFYDGLGALLDVGQNHILQMLALVAMDKPKIMNSENIHRARLKILEKLFLYKNKKEKSLIRAQYNGYLDELNVNKNSNTETFFRATLGVNSSKWKGVPFVIESGKGLSKSEAYLEVCFSELKYCLKFSVSHSEGVVRDAYEKVFYDAIVGDQTVFVSTKEVMAQWKIVTEIIKKWKNIPLKIYEKGSRAEDIF